MASEDIKPIDWFFSEELASFHFSIDHQTLLKSLESESKKIFFSAKAESQTGGEVGISNIPGT
jgi:retron-type reverse transcriptase